MATTAGEVELAIPKLRTGSFFPSLLHPRRRVDKALYAVICQAWIEGVSTRKAWRPGAGPGQRVGHQPLHGLKDPRRASTRACTSSCPAAWTAPGSPTCSSTPRTWTCAWGTGWSAGRWWWPPACRPRAAGRSRNMALGDAETTDFWTSFLRSLRERGLKVPSPEDPTGVVLVTSDAHAGIRAAVRAILPGAAWQRCRVHFARNITSRLGSARTRAGQRARLDHLRPDQSGGRHRPVQARHRFPEGGLPRDRSDVEGRRAGPDRVRRLPPGALDQDPAAATPSSASTARSSAAQTSPRVFPDSDSARPLIGSALPEQRGVAVRRTPIPLPDLPAAPDRHAPHRQHRRHRQSRRPAPHHHLTERTPHQGT